MLPVYLFLWLKIIMTAFALLLHKESRFVEVLFVHTWWRPIVDWRSRVGLWAYSSANDRLLTDRPRRQGFDLQSKIVLVVHRFVSLAWRLVTHYRYCWLKLHCRISLAINLQTCAWTHHVCRCSCCLLPGHRCWAIRDSNRLKTNVFAFKWHKFSFDRVYRFLLSVTDLA